MYLIVASLNLGQDVANERERKQTAAHVVAKSYPLYLTVKICRYVSLININPSAPRFFAQLYSCTFTFTLMAGRLLGVEARGIRDGGPRWGNIIAES